MSKCATISTHGGSQVCRQHNLRNEKVIKHEPHINPMGRHEVWKDETERHAYHRLFGQAQKDYNERQTRNDRKITDYYRQIKDNPQKHTAYEMIVGIYPTDETEISAKEQTEILHKFFETWKERNPNLELIGAYYHFDEESKSPHVHLDYIPVAKCNRGMSLQNGLERALNQMGYETKNIKMTAQMQWQQAQRDYLKELCLERGIEVLQPQTQKQHLETKAFKLSKEIEEKQLELGLLNNIKPSKETIVKKNRLGMVVNKDEIEEYIQKLENTIKTQQEVEKTLTEANKRLTEAYNTRRDAKRIDTLKKIEIQAFDKNKEQHQQKIKTYKQILAKHGIADPFQKQQHHHRLEL